MGPIPFFAALCLLHSSSCSPAASPPPAESMIDHGRALYNPHGSPQRADELAPLTRRQGVPSACAVFQSGDDLPSRASGDRLGRAFKSVGRLSDALGRTAHT